MIALWSNNNAEDKLMHMRNLHVLPVVLPAKSKSKGSVKHNTIC